MATPTHLLTASYFYAAGNTPAVNLTSPIPPDQDADVLLLGCGDLRNVLFSVYAGVGSGVYFLVLMLSGWQGAHLLDRQKA